MKALTDNKEAVILFMNLLKALVTGEPYNFDIIPEEKVWKGLRALCAHHNMYPIIYEQLCLTGVFENMEADGEIDSFTEAALDLGTEPSSEKNCRNSKNSDNKQNYQFLYEEFLYKEKEHFRLRAFRMIVMQMNRTMALEDYYKDILEIGVKTLLVKGLVLRDCWPDGNLRISGDEDFLIRPEDYHTLKEFFLDRGFRMEKEESEKGLPDEMGFAKKDEDVFYEVHRTLFSENSAFFSRFNDVFKDAFSDAISFQRGEYYFYTLDPTRHLFFVLSHMLKHFVMGGVGIRQLIDILMFIRRYDKQIDRRGFGRLLEDFGLQIYWVNLMEIARLYLGFEADDYGMQFFGDIIPDPADMLEDMLDAGIFGGTSIERMHSANITLETTRNHGLAGRLKGIWVSLFPGREYMEQRYPANKGSKWFLPKAYIRRFVDYATSQGNKKSMDASRESALKIGMQRSNLLKKYKIHCRE